LFIFFHGINTTTHSFSSPARYAYFALDACTDVILVAAFVTVFEVCSVCHRQNIEDDPHKQTPPRGLRIGLILIWFLMTAGVTVCDLILSQGADLRWRGIPYLCYAVTFAAVALLIQWVIRHLHQTFTQLMPEVFLPSSLSSLIEPLDPKPELPSSPSLGFVLDETQVASQQKHQRNLLLQSLRRTYDQFSFLSRICQLVSISFTIAQVAFGIMLLDSGNKYELQDDGTFSPLEFIMCWLQIITLALMAWYAWIPWGRRSQNVYTENEIAAHSNSIEASLLSPSKIDVSETPREDSQLIV